MANFAGQATMRLDLTSQDKAHNHRVQAFTSSNPGASSGAIPVSASSNQAFELAADQTVTLHYVFRAADGAPTGDTLEVWISVYEDNSAVVALAEVKVLDVASNANQHTGSTTFTPTKAGTYRIRVRAVFDANGNSLTGGYTANSDSPTVATQGAAPLWVTTADENSPGYLRAGVDVTAIDVDNSGSFDGPPNPFAWPDTVRLRTTVSNAAVANSSSLVIDADTLNVAAAVRDSQINASISSTTWSDTGGTAQLDKTDPASFGIKIGQPANSALSARPWVHFESAPVGWTLGTTDGTKSVEITRQSFLNWDSAVTIDHHLQLNDNVYDDLLDVTSRLTSDLGFVTFTLSNARGEPINDITVTETLQDANALVAAVINRSVATGANGRPASFATWDSQIPGGSWIHTVDITSPSGLTGEEANPTDNWTLLAPNSAYAVLCSAGGATDGQHFNQGDDFIAGGGLVNGVTGQLLTPGGTPCVIIARQSDTGFVEYLDATFAWNQLDGAEEAYCHNLLASDLIIPGADPRVFLLIISAATGVDWGASGISCLFRILDSAGTPYIGQASVFVSGGNNKHSEYKFDPIGLFK